MDNHYVQRRLSLGPLALLAFGFGALALGVGCSGGVGLGGPSASTVPGAATSTSTIVESAVTTTLQLDTPTTFIANCAQMPAVAAISSIVGIPLTDGQVVAVGTCQYLGLNDQSRVVTLTLLTDPSDQAAFKDLELSLGVLTPLNDPTLANAFVDPNSLVYIITDAAIYTVQTLVTDTTPAEQVPLSVAVLHLWLGV